MNASMSMEQRVNQFVNLLHLGKENAVVAPIIQREMGLEPSPTSAEVRSIARWAIHRYGHPIGSCNKGFYIMSNADELKDNLRVLQSRMDNLQARKDGIVRAFNKTHSITPPQKVSWLKKLWRGLFNR